MGFNYLFIWAIYALVFVLTLFVIKAVFQTTHLKKTANKNYLILEENLLQENSKLEGAKQKVLLIEELHKTLFNRLFKITTDVILMQKFIFETYTK